MRQRRVYGEVFLDNSSECDLMEIFIEEFRAPRVTSSDRDILIAAGIKQMKRIISAIAAVVFFLPGEAAFPANPNRAAPNVIFIMADDMGYECVGANGSTFYKTPHLDRLAAGGMRVTHAYSQPLCTPSRVQIMTGRYNSRNYVRFGYLHPNEITFGNVMKKAGYKTCIAGKWQLLGGVEGTNNFGFDEYWMWQLTHRH
ncbi:MAG: sulfatase-like hydrolase/transferase [Planctomycetales bacterium]